MAGGVEGEKPRPDFSPQQSNPAEHIGPQQGSPADTPLAPLLRERRSGKERSHEQLVVAFQHAIQRERQTLGELAKYHSPVKILDAEFRKQVQYIFSDNKEDKQRGEFFAQILHAWEALAYEHYGKESVNSGDLDRHYAGLDLDTQYKRAKDRKDSHPEIITLTDPLQARIIDAAAEAVGIPHHRGQTTFEIPEKLRDYEAQVHQANEEWRHRER